MRQKTIFSKKKSSIVCNFLKLFPLNDCSVNSNETSLDREHCSRASRKLLRITRTIQLTEPGGETELRRFRWTRCNACRTGGI